MKFSDKIFLRCLVITTVYYFTVGFFNISPLNFWSFILLRSLVIYRYSEINSDSKAFAGNLEFTKIYLLLVNAIVLAKKTGIDSEIPFLLLILFLATVYYEKFFIKNNIILVCLICLSNSSIFGIQFEQLLIFNLASLYLCSIYYILFYFVPLSPQDDLAQQFFAIHRDISSIMKKAYYQTVGTKELYRLQQQSNQEIQQLSADAALEKYLFETKYSSQYLNLYTKNFYLLCASNISLTSQGAQVPKLFSQVCEKSIASFTGIYYLTDSALQQYLDDIDKLINAIIDLTEQQANKAEYFQLCYMINLVCNIRYSLTQLQLLGYTCFRKRVKV